MKLVAPAVLKAGGLPLAARCAILCAVCLWVGLLTLELTARNHERAMELHERQRELVAREAINQRLVFQSESHQPGFGAESPLPIERPGKLRRDDAAAVPLAQASQRAATKPKSVASKSSASKSSASKSSAAKSKSSVAKSGASQSSVAKSSTSKPSSAKASPAKSGAASSKVATTVAVAARGTPASRASGRSGVR
jgi:hypothetical protein